MRLDDVDRPPDTEELTRRLELPHTRRLDEIDPALRAAVENGDLHSVNLDYAVVDPAPYECRQKVSTVETITPWRMSVVA